MKENTTNPIIEESIYFLIANIFVAIDKMKTFGV